MAWIVIPSLLSKRPWARIRARCEASFFIVLSKSIRCCSVRGRTYLTLMDLDLGFTYVLFWSYRENIIPKNFWLGTYTKVFLWYAPHNFMVYTEHFLFYHGKLL